MMAGTDTAPQLPGLTLVRRLDSGGYADVFLYEQDRPRMRVAVKVMSAEGLSEQARERFAAEANAMAELADHPYIVQVFRADTTADGRPYLVMKYYPQRNLAVRAQTERLEVSEVLRIGVRIACAVETAHRAGILHRDIKPANILTSQYGDPGLTDFGIATTKRSEGSGEAEGVSIPWAPPEVLYGTSPGERSADVYSLGASLWHLLVGRSPFEEPGGDNSAVALMRRIREHTPPRTGRDDVPASLERLLGQCLAKDPADRPSSALQVARSLQTIETEQHWSPTPLVVLDETAVDDDAADVDAEQPQTGSRTRFRTPQTVVPRTGDVPSAPQEPATVRRPQVASSPRPVATPVASERPARVRHGMPGVPDDPVTMRRPTSPVEKAVPVVDATVERSRPRRVWALTAVSVAVVGIVVGVGVALAEGGSGHPSSTTLANQAPTLPVAAAVAPTVTGTRVDATHVRFSWTPDPSDTYAWQQLIDGTSQWGPYHPTSADSVTLSAATGDQICLEVTAKSRLDTSETATSPTTCAGGS